jgi:hypothetical protein
MIRGSIAFARTLLLMLPDAPSKSRLNKAGDTLRSFADLLKEGKQEEVRDALDVLFAWRASHSRPLQTASTGLRSRVQSG